MIPLKHPLVDELNRALEEGIPSGAGDAANIIHGKITLFESARTPFRKRFSKPGTQPLSVFGKSIIPTKDVLAHFPETQVNQDILATKHALHSMYDNDVSQSLISAMAQLYPEFNISLIGKPNMFHLEQTGISGLLYEVGRLTRESGCIPRLALPDSAEQLPQPVRVTAMLLGDNGAGTKRSRMAPDHHHRPNGCRATTLNGGASFYEALSMLVKKVFPNNNNNNSKNNNNNVLQNENKIMQKNNKINNNDNINNRIMHNNNNNKIMHNKNITINNNNIDANGVGGFSSSLGMCSSSVAVFSTVPFLWLNLEDVQPPTSSPLFVPCATPLLRVKPPRCPKKIKQQPSSIDKDDDQNSSSILTALSPVFTASSGVLEGIFNDYHDSTDNDSTMETANRRRHHHASPIITTPSPHFEVVQKTAPGTIKEKCLFIVDYASRLTLGISIHVFPATPVNPAMHPMVQACEPLLLPARQLQKQVSEMDWLKRPLQQQISSSDNKSILKSICMLKKNKNSDMSNGDRRVVSSSGSSTTTTAVSARTSSSSSSSVLSSPDLDGGIIAQELMDLFEL